MMQLDIKRKMLIKVSFGQKIFCRPPTLSLRKKMKNNVNKNNSVQKDRRLYILLLTVVSEKDR